MEINFSSKKGLFGYKLESDRTDYKKLSRLATGKTYSVKATESGISIYKNGELVAEGLDRIKHQDDKTFFIGFKGDQKFLFDQVNEREMAIAHGYKWGPSFIVALDGTTFQEISVTLALGGGCGGGEGCRQRARCANSDRAKGRYPHCGR